MPVRITVIALCIAAGLIGQPLAPAERAVAEARKAIEREPQKPDGYNALAMALARRARETADTAKYDEARAALEKALELAQDNFESKKIGVWLLLGKHEFAEALKVAKELNRRMPDDEMVYGLLVDAYAELGDYKEAESAAQWMLDLSRAGVPALTRAAYLREFFGDIEGAGQLMESAYSRTRPEESEDRAWLLTQLAHLKLVAGKTEEAERLLSEALRIFPGYHYALANMAKVRTAQGKHVNAAELLKERYSAAPHPENLYDLAAALKRAGNPAEARKAFAQFERDARAEMKSWDNANRELIFYYTDHARKPVEALRVAELEIGRRRDVYTLDAYAWALHANGRTSEARKQIETALAVGTRDPKILHHADVIRGTTIQTARRVFHPAP